MKDYREELDKTFSLGDSKVIKDFIKSTGKDFTRKGIGRWVCEEDDERGSSSKHRETCSFSLTNGKFRSYGIDKPDKELEANLLAEFTLSQANWPKIIPALNIEKLRQRVGRDAKLFVCRNINSQILMVQQRLDFDDGRKVYVNWCLVSNGEWYALEPDLLPIWGVEQLKGYAGPIMLHEGPKTAYFVTEVLAGNIDCPWPDQVKKELSRYIHLGWPGGAMNSDRVDWSVLKEKEFSQIILVADNDDEGKEAAPRISLKLAGLKVKCIMFNDRFPRHFDLSDQWPRHKEWWSVDADSGVEYYSGEILRDMTRSATWATRIVRTGEKGRPSIGLRPEFASEWRHSAEPDAFVHIDYPDKVWSRAAFNRWVKPFSDKCDDVARLLDNSIRSAVETIGYHPRLEGNKTEVVTLKGRSAVNTFRPTGLIPDPTVDITPFHNFLKHLLPDFKDQHTMDRWVTTLAARPDIKMTYSPLLISEQQGVGKTTLGVICQHLVGTWNTGIAMEYDITDSPYNDWATHKRLILVNEIYSEHSKKAYQKLQGILAGDDLRVNTKHVQQYVVDLWCVAVMCSNSQNAMYLPDKERKIFVPRVTEDIQPKEYWKDLYDWLFKRHGMEGIYAWCLEQAKDEKNIVHSGERPPETEAKREIQDSYKTEPQKLAYDIGLKAVKFAKNGPVKLMRNNDGEAMAYRPGGITEDIWTKWTDGGCKIAIVVDDLRGFIAEDLKMKIDDSRLAKAFRLRTELMNAGMLEPPREPGAKEDRRINVDGKMKYVVTNYKLTSIKWADIKREAAHTMEWYRWDVPEDVEENS